MKKLTCHCGGIEIEVNVPEPFTKVIRCNCSLCKRRGTIMTMVGPDDLKIIKVPGNFWHGTKTISSIPSETIYFLTKILNDLNLKKIRNNILSEALPIKV